MITTKTAFAIALLFPMAAGYASSPEQSTDDAAELPRLSSSTEEGVSAPFAIDKQVQVKDVEQNIVLLPPGDYKVLRIDELILIIVAVNGERQATVKAESAEWADTDWPGIAYVSGQTGELVLRTSWRNGETLQVPLLVAEVQSRSIQIVTRDLQLRMTGPPSMAEISKDATTLYNLYVKNVGNAPAQNFTVLIRNQHTYHSMRVQLDPYGATRILNRCSYVPPKQLPEGFYTELECPIEELAPGAERRIEFSAKYRRVSGYQQAFRYELAFMQAFADYRHRVVETNESNNYKSWGMKFCCFGFSRP